MYDQNRTDCDVWVFNEMLGKREWIIRADAVFQLHEETIWRNPLNRTHPQHYEWLRTQTEVPVYMQEQYPDVPMSVKYPLEEIKQTLLPHFNKLPFNSTPAYALALGIYQGYKEIETYGIELGTDTEYFFQREGFTFWCGLAVGKGIHLTVYTNKLLNAPLYGYEGEWSIPKEDFIARAEFLTPPADEARDAYNQVAEIVNERIQAYTVHTDQEHYNPLASVINDLQVKAHDFGLLDGAIQENERYTKRAQAMIDTTGTYIFSRQELESAKMSLMEKHGDLRFNVQDRHTKLTMLLQALLLEDSEEGKRTKILAIPAVIDNYVKSVLNLAMVAGAIAENNTYLQRIDAGIRALGGESAYAVMKGGDHDPMD